MKSRRGQLLDALSDLVDQLDDSALETLVCAAKMALKPGAELGAEISLNQLLAAVPDPDDAA